MAMTDEEKREKKRLYNANRGYYFEVVLHPPLNKIVGGIQDYLLSTCSLFCDRYCYYAYILHNNDINESGEVKPIHCHIIIKTPNITTSKSIKDTFLNLFSDFDSSLVDVNKITNIYGYHRYLLHLDNPEKHKYQFTNIYTSNVNKCYSFVYCNENDLKHVIIDSCKRSHGNFELLVFDLGLEMVTKYNKVIYMYYRSKGWF